MKVLSIAHECVIEGEKGAEFYQGPSPDEIELVTFAKKVGFQLAGSDKSFVTVHMKSNVLSDESVNF